jgi:ribosome-binding protein aMBF1 (putative translation factor)
VESSVHRENPRSRRLRVEVARIGGLLRDLPPERGEAMWREIIMATDLGELLRDAIRKSGLTSTALSKASGVNTAVILRFLAGQRDITLATASRLAGALGMRLTAPKRRRGKAE